MKKIKLITHEVDLDGRSCIIVMHFMYGVSMKEYDVMLENYHTINDTLAKFIKDKEYRNYDMVFITDMNISLESAKLIQGVMEEDPLSCRFVLVDHHDTNRTALNTYNWTIIETIGSDGDMISATKLLFSMFEYTISPCYRKGLHEFVNLVSLYDTYLWQERGIQDAKDLHILMSLYGKDEFVKKMIDNLSKTTPFNTFIFSELDTVILNIEKKRIARYMMEKLFQVKKYTLYGKMVGIVFAETRQYCSELGQLICKELNCDVALMIDIARREVSLRSVTDDFHLGNWVEGNFHGGGHDKAAGYQFNEGINSHIMELITHKTNFMPIHEFRKLGLLFEVNRTFFHPLGLSMTVLKGKDGHEYLAGIDDHRHDPDGMIYDPLDIDKMKTAQQFIKDRHDMRNERLGFIIQEKNVEHGEI